MQNSRRSKSNQLSRRDRQQNNRISMSKPQNRIDFFYLYFFQIYQQCGCSKIDYEEAEIEILSNKLSSLHADFSLGHFFLFYIFGNFFAIDLARRGRRETRDLKTCATENQWDPPRCRLSVENSYNLGRPIGHLSTSNGPCRIRELT